MGQEFGGDLTGWFWREISDKTGVILTLEESPENLIENRRAGSHMAHTG